MNLISSRHVIQLAIVAAFLCLTGCQQLGLSDGPSESSARATLTAELDKWIVGEESKATTMDWRLGRYQPPLAYKIRTVVSEKPQVPQSHLGNANNEKDILALEAGVSFRAVVDLDFRSKADTAITKMATYHVIWLEKTREWLVEETF